MGQAGKAKHLGFTGTRTKEVALQQKDSTETSIIRTSKQDH